MTTFAALLALPLALGAPEPTRLEARLAGTAPVAVAIELARIPGRLAPPGVPPAKAIDAADYSKAGMLELSAPCLAGTEPGPVALVPAGRHGIGLEPRAEGPPALRLALSDGQRVLLPLAPVAEARHPGALEAEGRPGADGASWTLVVHAPTVSGSLRLVAVPAPLPIAVTNPVERPPDAGALIPADPGHPGAPALQAPPPPPEAAQGAAGERRQSRSDRIRERVHRRPEGQQKRDPK